MAPEQLGPHQGHLTRMGRTLRKNKNFIKKIAHVSVDESHVVASAGMPGINGEAPYRPAYGHLDSFRLLLPKSTSFSALSATITPYVERLLQKKLALRPNNITLRAGLNRPNISYASLDIVDTVSNFRNLDFLVPDLYHPPMILQKTMVFFDTQNMSRDASRYINSKFLKVHQDLGISRHYHSGMSAEYLEQTYNDFVSDTGNCLIFCATKGASTVRILCVLISCYSCLMYWSGHRFS